MSLEESIENEAPPRERESVPRDGKKFTSPRKAEVGQLGIGRLGGGTMYFLVGASALFRELRPPGPDGHRLPAIMIDLVSLRRQIKRFFSEF